LPGRTVKSASPCQIDTSGQSVVPLGALARTADAHWAGVRVGGVFMQLKAVTVSVAQPTGIPAMIAPAVKTSG
jgi:hypothetical protein